MARPGPWNGDAEVGRRRDAERVRPLPEPIVAEVSVGDEPMDLSHRRRRRIVVQSLRDDGTGLLRPSRVDEVATPDTIIDIAYRVLARDLMRFDDETRDRSLTPSERRGLNESIKSLAGLRRIDIEIERQEREQEQGMTPEEARAWIARNAPRLLGSGAGRNSDDHGDSDGPSGDDGGPGGP